MFILNLLLFLIALSLLIFVHELGHFIFAKLFNVYCMEFSLGMGPAVFSKKFKKDPETKYSLRYLPIGGYVAMAGEVDDNEQEKELNIPPERTINGIKAWKRAIITVAGVTFNFILAIILIAIVTFSVGKPTNKISVENNSIAYNAGLRNNDKITSIDSNIIKKNGKDVYSTCIKKTCEITVISDLVDIVNTIKDKDVKFDSTEYTQEIVIKYVRDNKTETTTLTRTYDAENKSVQVYGIAMVYDDYSILGGIGATFQTFWDTILAMFTAFGMLFTKEGINQVGGPVQVYTFSVQMASQGIIPYLSFLALLSINLVFFNLLPIPGLDGARFYLSIGEAVTNKKFNPKIETYINLVGIFFLFGLMILVTIKDIFMLF